MVTETGSFLNQAAKVAARDGLGFGEAIAVLMEEHQLPLRRESLLWRCWKAKVPVTVHVAIGADIHHTHPSTNGSFLGEATFNDFKLLCGIVATLTTGSVAINIGSAVQLPVTIEKAFSVARNQGYPVEGFLGVNMDFIQHYRANNNPVNRARELGGEGYSLTGHHELLLPLLYAGLIEQLG